MKTLTTSLIERGNLERTAALLDRLNADDREEQGFSLIELIIVIVIIGILTAIAIPVFGNIQDNARVSSTEAAATNAHSAAAAAHTDSSDERNPLIAAEDVIPADHEEFVLDTESSVLSANTDIDDLCVAVNHKDLLNDDGSATSDHPTPHATAGGGDCATGSSGGDDNDDGNGGDGGSDGGDEVSSFTHSGTANYDLYLDIDNSYVHEAHVLVETVDGDVIIDEELSISVYEELNISKDIPESQVGSVDDLPANGGFSDTVLTLTFNGEEVLNEQIDASGIYLEEQVIDEEQGIITEEWDAVNVSVYFDPDDYSEVQFTNHNDFN